MTAEVRHLRPVLTVALDLEQELSERQAGPVFNDEYTDLLMDIDPDDNALERMTELERIQDGIQSKFLELWTDIATKLAAEQGVDLYVNLGGAEDDGPLSAQFRAEVNALISVSTTVTGEWVVSQADTPPVRV